VYIGTPQYPFPPLFTLWLAGMDITHTVSRDHKSTGQAQVEHTHRTLDDMVWKDAHLISLAQLQHA
jgi:hypothetical protein